MLEKWDHLHQADGLYCNVDGSVQRQWYMFDGSVCNDDIRPALHHATALAVLLPTWICFGSANHEGFSKQLPGISHNTHCDATQSPPSPPLPWIIAPTQKRRAFQNRRLRRNGRRNRILGPPKREMLLGMGLPVYLIDKLLLPLIPTAVSQQQFDTEIAHDVERGSDTYYQFWVNNREAIGNIMEYQFRRQFSIPVHFPREVMKTIFLFAADEDIAKLFGGEGWWTEPLEVHTFVWPRPFCWPPR